MNQTAGLFQRMYNNTVPMLQRMEQNCDWKSPYGLQTDLLLTLSLIFHRITLSLSGKESWRKTSSSSSSLLSFPSVGGWYILRLATTTNYIRYLVPGTLVLVPAWWYNITSHHHLCIFPNSYLYVQSLKCCKKTNVFKHVLD